MCECHHIRCTHQMEGCVHGKGTLCIVNNDNSVGCILYTFFSSVYHCPRAAVSGVEGGAGLVVVNRVYICYWCWGQDKNEIRFRNQEGYETNEIIFGHKCHEIYILRGSKLRPWIEFRKKQPLQQEHYSGCMITRCTACISKKSNNKRLSLVVFKRG